MRHALLIAGLVIGLAAAPALGLAADEKEPAAKPETSKPAVSLKANMGGRNMEVEVHQTKEGLSVKGTMDDQVVEATGTRQEDGTLKVEVNKDKETMLEVTINPEAVRQMSPSQQPSSKP